MTSTFGRSSRRFGGSSGTPTARGFQPDWRNPSERAEQLGAQPRDAEDPGAGVGADDRADLRDQLGVAAVDLAAALGHALGLGERLHVLDGETVAAVLAALL